LSYVNCTVAEKAHCAATEENMQQQCNQIQRHTQNTHNVKLYLHNQNISYQLIHCFL